jgi:hypothetical protein
MWHLAHCPGTCSLQTRTDSIRYQTTKSPGGPAHAPRAATKAVTSWAMLDSEPPDHACLPLVSHPPQCRFSSVMVHARARMHARTHAHTHTHARTHARTHHAGAQRSLIVHHDLGVTCLCPAIRAMNIYNFRTIFQRGGSSYTAAPSFYDDTESWDAIAR